MQEHFRDVNQDLFNSDWKLKKQGTITERAQDSVNLSETSKLQDLKFLF